MILAPTDLQHGERYGRLTVIRKAANKAGRGPKYVCGCACGYAPVFVKASHLTSGRVTACVKCATRANTGER